MLYITSDLHYHHRNILKYCNRPYEFSSEGVAKMNEDILKQFDELPVGCRPDTIVLSNLPLNWFQLDNNHSIHSSHCLYHFLSQFGTIR